MCVINRSSSKLISLQRFVEYRPCMGRQSTASVSKLEYDKITNEIGYVKPSRCRVIDNVWCAACLIV